MLGWKVKVSVCIGGRLFLACMLGGGGWWVRAVKTGRVGGRQAGKAAASKQANQPATHTERQADRALVVSE